MFIIYLSFSVIFSIIFMIPVAVPLLKNHGISMGGRAQRTDLIFEVGGGGRRGLIRLLK